MKQSGLFILLLSSVCIAHAQVATEALQPLSKEDANQLLQGATIEFTSLRGNQLRWKNELDGTMWASSVGSSGSSTTKGSWKINDKGRFCVSIDWPSNLEKWCRSVVREGDTYYLVRRNGERVSKLSVRR